MTPLSAAWVAGAGDMIQSALRARNRGRKPRTQGRPAGDSQRPRRKTQHSYVLWALALVLFVAGLYALGAAGYMPGFGSGFLGPRWAYWSDRVCRGGECGANSGCADAAAFTKAAQFCRAGGGGDAPSMRCLMRPADGAVVCEMLQPRLDARAASIPAASARRGMLGGGAIHVDCVPSGVPVTAGVSGPASAIALAMAPRPRGGTTPSSNCGSRSGTLVVMPEIKSAATETGAQRLQGTIDGFVAAVWSYSVFSAAGPGSVAISSMSEPADLSLWSQTLEQARVLSTPAGSIEGASPRVRFPFTAHAEADVGQSGSFCYKSVLISVTPPKLRAPPANSDCASEAVGLLARALRRRQAHPASNAATEGFTLFADSDAYPGQDFGNPQPAGTPSCRAWCAQRPRCTGFTVFQNVCYFRDQADLQTAKRPTPGAALYVKNKASAVGASKALANAVYLSEPGMSPGYGPYEEGLFLISGSIKRLDTDELGVGVLADALREASLVFVGAKTAHSMPSLPLLLPPCAKLIVCPATAAEAKQVAALEAFAAKLRPDVAISRLQPPRRGREAEISSAVAAVRSAVEAAKQRKCSATGVPAPPQAQRAAVQRQTQPPPPELPPAQSAAIGAGLGGSVGKFVSESGQHRLGVIVPFRDSKSMTSQGFDRTKNLLEFVPYMTAFLKKAGVDFEIVIAEQTQGAIFNKGAMFNAGFMMVRDRVDYVVLHDVDQVPENPANTYAWPAQPTHLCSASSQWNYRPSYGQMVGGAIIMQNKHYAKINGFSNSYFGWGQEDDDFYFRLTKGGFRGGGPARLSPAIGRYKALAHKRVKDLDVTKMFKRGRKHLDRQIHAQGIPKEGLSTIKFDIVGDPKTDNPPGCTRYLVQLKLPWMPKSLDETPPDSLHY